MESSHKELYLWHSKYVFIFPRIQSDIETFVNENLNEHRKGILGKAVPVANMLTWTKVSKKILNNEYSV